MRITLRSTARSAVALLCLFGCSSQTPAAKAPDAPAGDTKLAKSEPAAPKPEEKPAASEPSEPDPRGDGLRKASRPPAELITGPNLVYVFNFKDSAIGIAAKEDCEAKSGGDRGAAAACMEKARSKVPVEFVRFVKEPDGEHWWITYNRYKGNLLKWHKVQFKPGAETEDRLTLNLFGKDKGIAPMARVPRELSIELPNDYTIVLNDPDNGPMQYDAKIGTMDD